MSDINKIIFGSALLICVFSCSTEKIEIENGLQSFQFKIISPGNLGSESELLPAETNKIVFQVKAIGSKGQDPFILNKEVSIYLNFGGRSSFIKSISITDGVSSEESVEISDVYGKAHLMVVDDTGDEPSYATGSSDEIYFRNPSLDEIQKSGDEQPPFKSLMAGYRVNIRGQKGNIGRMVITAVTNSGFYVTDLASALNPPSSLFVYNFSRPYGVYRYQMLCQLTGGVQEHLGDTQITFPDWISYDDCKQSDSLLCKICVDELKQYEGKNKINFYKLNTETTYDKKLMESLESSLVEIENATIMNMFESAYDRDTYTDYGQYKVRLNDTTASATFLVISRDNVSDFDPAKYIGKSFSYVRGVLTELNFGSKNSMWIVNVRDKYDICIEDYCPKKN
ncbi:MAG: hypothetical protein N3B13_03320 [Deltaproteobacteria bacterium]|nr:hypothetical protein [Deltaproteobacteria bacterium]